MLPARRAWFEAQGYAPVPYLPAHVHEAQAFLLVTPVRVGDNFLRPDGVWAQYFSKVNPSAVLLQAGIRDRAIGPNYLHWSHLPDDFELFLQSAQRAGKGWMPPDYGEKKLEVIWQRFWDGHNKAGFVDWFSATLMFLKIVDDNLQKGPQQELPQKAYLSDTDNQQSFQNTHLRWKAYLPYLLLAPFSDQIEEADQLLRDVEPGWADCTDYATLADRIHTHRVKIEAADELLIRLSKYFKTDAP